MPQRLALLAMLLVACERETKPGADTSTAAAAPAAAVSVGANAGAGATTAVAARPICPATGLWSECQLVYRLERSGLVPMKDSSVTPVLPMGMKGVAIKVGRATLSAYFFKDAAEREAAMPLLRRDDYVVYPAPVPMRPVPTLISSANLIAILDSRNDHLRERVSDAITAGPPQPARP